MRLKTTPRRLLPREPAVPLTPIIREPWGIKGDGLLGCRIHPDVLVRLHRYWKRRM